MKTINYAIEELANELFETKAKEEKTYASDYEASAFISAHLQKTTEELNDIKQLFLSIWETVKEEKTSEILVEQFEREAVILAEYSIVLSSLAKKMANSMKQRKENKC